MSGGLINYFIIGGNIIIVLNNSFKDFNCIVLNGDVWFWIDYVYFFVYFDVMVVCGEI